MYCFFSACAERAATSRLHTPHIHTIIATTGTLHHAPHVPLHGPARDLCVRFLDESLAKHGELKSEAYIRWMLSPAALPTILNDARGGKNSERKTDASVIASTPNVDQNTTRGEHGALPGAVSDSVSSSARVQISPSAMETTSRIDNDDPPLNERVLDKLCHEDAPDRSSRRRKFLPDFSSSAKEDGRTLLRQHPMYLALEKALERDGVGRGDSLLLSLSGGVDSTAHAVALVLLRERFGYELAAMHVRHSNRPEENTDEEERWVRWIAGEIGITL